MSKRDDLIAQVTQMDIAKKLNVTRITVSKALRNHFDISMKMKKNVSETAEELGYVLNLLAQTFTPSLKVIYQNPRKIGLTAKNMLIEEIENENSDKKKHIEIIEAFQWNASILRQNDVENLSMG